jgi:hypothetical protein
VSGINEDASSVGSGHAWSHACAALDAIEKSQKLISKIILADWTTLVRNFGENDDFDYEEWASCIDDGFEIKSSWQSHSLVTVQADLERTDGPDLNYLVALRIPLDYSLPHLADSEADVIADALIHGKPRLEYLSQPRFCSSKFLIGTGLDGPASLLCGLDCRGMDSDIDSS